MVSTDCVIMGQSTSRWDFLKRPEWGFPAHTTGPPAPRPPTPGMHFPAGTHIPDWRQYRVEDVPQLMEVKKKLAARGLKDPWLRYDFDKYAIHLKDHSIDDTIDYRNDVWRYDQKSFGTQKWRYWGLIAPGMLYGLAMFVVLVVCEETILKEKDDHNSHH